MEIEEQAGLPVFSSTELDMAEGKAIEELKAHSQKPIPDPDRWLDEELSRHILLARLDDLLNWSRTFSLWTVICFPACCAFELITTAASRFDISRFGMEFLRA